MPDEKPVGLTDDERAYFETEGETPLVPDTGDNDVEKEGLQAETERVEDEKGRFVKTVPHQAFHQEREERKRAEQRETVALAELQELKQFKAAMEERMRLAQQPAPPDPLSDLPPEDDIIGRQQWIIDQIAQARQAGLQQQQLTAQQQAQQQQISAVFDRVNAAFVEAETVDPEVTDAYAYARKSFADELIAVGTPSNLIEHKLEELATRFALMAAENNRHPADMAKQIAMARGWRPKEQTAPDPANMRMPDRLARVERAQEQSRTIGKAPGASGATDDLTIDDLSKMPQHEFSAWLATPANKRMFEKLMGG